jgi:DNA-binding GntR family transcriptional regulator
VIGSGALYALGRLPTSPQIALDEHRRILDAIRQRDAETAMALMREHIYAGLKRYQQAPPADETQLESPDLETGKIE